jgi:hypothetical protein
LVLAEEFVSCGQIFSFHSLNQPKFVRIHK